MKYNLGKFNVKTTSSNMVGGKADLVLSTPNVNYIHIINGSGKSNVNFNTSCSVVLEIPFSGSSEMSFGTSGLSSIEVLGIPNNCEMTMNTSSKPEQLGVNYISINSGVGGEITIDMEQLTVFIDDINSIHLIQDGDFFALDSGDNQIEVTGDITDCKIIYRDRWL